MNNIGLSVTFDGKREEYFPDLMKWASENGASVDGFEMVNFKEEGFGLRATRDIKVSLKTVGLKDPGVVVSGQRAWGRCLGLVQSCVDK
jgi:hypothetical protein